MHLRDYILKPMTLALILISSDSCRPPPIRQVDEGRLRMYPDTQDTSGHAGQSPPDAYQTYYNLGDARPTAIKQADNPDFDPNANLFVSLWNTMFGGEEAPPPHPVNPPPPMPQDPGNDLDPYDIHGGKVDVGSSPNVENDPDIERYKNDQERQNAELNSLNQLKEQRDYLENEANNAVTSFNQQEVEGFNSALGQEFNKMEGEIEDSINAHNSNVDTLIYGDDVPDDETNDSFKTEKGSDQGEKVRGAESYVVQATTIVSSYSDENRNTAMAFMKMAEDSVRQADNFYYQGRNQEGDAFIKFSLRFIDVALGLVPASDNSNNSGAGAGAVGYGNLKSSAETKNGIEIRNEYTRLEYLKLNERIMTAEQRAHLRLAEDALYNADLLAGSRTDEEIENILGVASMEGDVAEGKVTIPPQTNYGWPLANGTGKGHITTHFGDVDASHPTPHGGTDIGIPIGTTVTSPVYGVVTQVGNDPLGFGNFVIVQHITPEGGNYQTIMAHNSSVTVRPGTYISEGQVIAISGSTGLSTGPHLHIEIRDCTGRKNCNALIKPGNGGPPRINPESLL